MPCGDYWYHLKCWFVQLEYVRQKLDIKIIRNTVDGETVFGALENRLLSVISCLISAFRISVGFPLDQKKIKAEFVYDNKHYSLTAADLKRLEQLNFWNITDCCTRVDISALLDIGTVFAGITEIQMKNGVDDSFETIAVPDEIHRYFVALPRAVKLFTEFTEVLRPVHLEILRVVVDISLKFSVASGKPWENLFKSTLDGLILLMSNHQLIPVICVSTEILEYVLHRIAIIKEFFSANKSAAEEFGVYATCISPVLVSAPIIQCNKCKNQDGFFFPQFRSHFKKCVPQNFVECSPEESTKYKEMLLNRADIIQDESIELPLIGISPIFERVLVNFLFFLVNICFLIHI